MATGILLPNGKQAFTDANGHPLAGGKVYFYAANTLTPKDTYQDPAMTILNTNPVILNARGEATIFGLGAYRQILKDASDVTIWDTTIPDMLAAVNDALAAFIASAGTTVNSIAELKALNHNNVKNALVTGYRAKGDGGNGYFYYDATDTTSADNGGTIIVATDNARWKRLYAGDLNVLWFGADRIGSLDSATAFQAAANVGLANALGLTVYVPAGNYLLTSGVFMDRSANVNLGRVSFKGEDQYATRLTYVGAGTSCFNVFNSPLAGAEPNASYQVISDMTILGPSQRANSSAVYANLAAFFKLERLLIEAFDFGLYLIDVDQSYFQEVRLRNNLRGLFASRNPSPNAASTQPNNHVYNQCTFSNNTQYGGLWDGGSSLVFIGGDVEYNGTNLTDFGLKFQNCGYEGSVGVNIQGTYFEGNYGIADIFLEATAVNAYPILDCVHTVSANFKRLNNTRVATNHIQCAFGDPAVVGHQSLVTVGCGFKAYAAYTPTGARPTIGFSLMPPSIDTYTDVGSYFGVAAEKPAFIQNLNKIDLQCGRATAQTFASGVTALWAIDTVYAATGLWNPTLGGRVVIPFKGTYDISFFGILSTATAGYKYATFKKNGSIIGFGECTGAINIITANCLARFNAGDVLTVEYTQNTGANQDIGGSGSVLTNLTIAKVY